MSKHDSENEMCGLVISTAALDANNRRMRELAGEKEERRFALRFHPQWRVTRTNDSPEAMRLRMDRETFIVRTPCEPDCEGCRLMEQQRELDRQLAKLHREER